MISKMSTGSGFSGAAMYIAKSDSLVLKKNNIFSNHPKKQAQEFRAVASSAKTKKPVLHVSLSIAPGEKATSDQWIKASEAYLQKMGFDLDKTQYTVTQHADQKHDHVHILANRVMADGKVLSSSKDYYRSMEATREAELAANLPKFENSKSLETGKIYDLWTSQNSVDIQ